MSMMKKTLLAALALALALTGAVRAAADTPWSQSVTVRASDFNPAVPGGVLVHVVGAGETLLLTDVVMTHNVTSTTGTFRANIRRGSASNPTACSTASPVLGPYVSPLQTVSLHLSSPLEFKSGEQICIVIGGASGTDGISFNLVGVKQP
jgi:hypothetical protein